MHAGLQRLHGVRLTVIRGSRAGQIINLITLDIERECHIVSNQLGIRVRYKMCNIMLCAGKEIINTNNIIPIC